MLDFNPDQWPGANDWEKYEAWSAERTRWAEANLPNGVAGLPPRFGAYVPDMPFDGTDV